MVAVPLHALPPPHDSCFVIPGDVAAIAAVVAAVVAVVVVVGVKSVVPGIVFHRHHRS